MCGGSPINYVHVAMSASLFGRLHFLWFRLENGVTIGKQAKYWHSRKWVQNVVCLRIHQRRMKEKIGLKRMAHIKSKGFMTRTKNSQFILQMTQAYKCAVYFKNAKLWLIFSCATCINTHNSQLASEFVAKRQCPWDKVPKVLLQTANIIEREFMQAMFGQAKRNGKPKGKEKKMYRK